MILWLKIKQSLRQKLLPLTEDANLKNLFLLVFLVIDNIQNRKSRASEFMTAHISKTRHGKFYIA